MNVQFPGELLQSALNMGQNSQQQSISSLNPAVRISVSGNSETEDDKPIRRKQPIDTLPKDPCEESVTNSNNARNTTANNIVVTNPMSVSVPNLTSTDTNSQIEPASAAG